MKYSKPALTFEQQADKLISRGLIADRDVLITRLKAVSYYRLSGYWYPFRNADSSFRDGTSLEEIWRRYVFDRQLRLIVIDGIERIEIAVRTSLVYYFSHIYGPFGYEHKANLPKLDDDRHSILLSKLLSEQSHSQEAFVAHFKKTYGDSHLHLPLWMAAEMATFGMLVTFFRGVDTAIKKQVADDFGVPDRVLESWLQALNVVRNICAHHGRLWNRGLGFKPMIPKENKHPEWHHPVKINNDRVFGILTIIKYMLNLIAPQSAWLARLDKLLDEYPEIPRTAMGFPQNWRECPVWAESSTSMDST